MTRLVRFSDDVIKGKWARIIMDDGSPCFIAIGPRSIVMKKSKTGIIGPRVFEVRHLKVVEQITSKLKHQFPQDLTPAGMTNVFLRPVVNAVLHCETLQEAINVLGSTENTIPS